MPTKESINLKEAIQIAKIIMAAPKDRLPIIQEVFDMAGVSLESLTALEEFGSLAGWVTLETLLTFLARVTDGKKAESEEFRVEAKEFTRLCEDHDLNPKAVRGQLAALGVIWQSAWHGGHAVTTCTVHMNGKVVRCVCIRKDWKARLFEATKVVSKDED